MPVDGEYEPSTSERSRAQVEEYETSGGTRGTTLRGMPVVIVTSVGARTGKVRKTPLMRVEHDGRYAAVASLGGAPQHPVWYHNLPANPHVELQDGPRKWDMTAREVAGEERDLWWERAVAAFPDYADYALATDRLIPVLVLEPRADGAGAHDDQRADASDRSDEAADGPEVPADEITDFWEVARGHAGIGEIAVVSGMSAAAGVVPPAWAFGDNPELADRLLALVLEGAKTATSSGLWEYGDAERVPEVGDLSIIVDGAGHPAALIRTTSVEQVAFDDVTEEHAAAEGEDDLSLESWRASHEAYFTRGLTAQGGQFSGDLPVVIERFEVVYPTPTPR